MGVLRLMLAMSVLVAHSSLSGKIFIPGDIAVQLFFVVSGFYMAMVINEKYTNNPKLFYRNRFFRLYPMYLAVVLLVFAAGFLSENVFRVHLNNYDGLLTAFLSGKIDLPALLFLTFSNLTGLLQDLTLFLRLDNAHMVFGNFMNSDPEIHFLMLVPQAWSLGPEVAFYALAPFVVKNKKRIVILLIASFLLKLGIFKLGYSSDPWNYRFFPIELSVFLLGAIGYHIYSKELFSRLKKFVPLLTIFLVCSFAAWPLLFHFTVLTRYFALVLFAIIVPYLFSYFKDRPVDNFIGELSYPFYLLHLLVIQLVNVLVAHCGLTAHIGGIIGLLVYFFVTVLISVLLMTLIQKRFDAIRARKLPVRTGSLAS